MFKINNDNRHIEVDLRDIPREETVFVPCPKCNAILGIRYDKETRCRCGIVISRSDDDTQTIESEIQMSPYILPKNVSIVTI